MQRLNLTMATPMDMVMDTPTDMDTMERGPLMRKPRSLVPTQKQRLALTMATPMDMVMDTPTDMDTMERGQLMRKPRSLVPTQKQRLTLIMAIGVDTTDPTMDMDTWERRKGLLRLMPILTQVLTLMLGGAIMDTPMAAIMAMVTIPMD